MAVNDMIFDEGGAVYNVKATAYGAKGDNSANDRDAIQNAIDDANAAGGGIVFFPEGVYLIKNTDVPP